MHTNVAYSCTCDIAQLSIISGCSKHCLTWLGMSACPSTAAERLPNTQPLLDTRAFMATSCKDLTYDCVLFANQMLLLIRHAVGLCGYSGQGAKCSLELMQSIAVAYQNPHVRHCLEHLLVCQAIHISA